MLRNKSQNSRLHGLLGELKMDKEELAEFKQQMALKFSNGRTDKTSALLSNECQALINYLLEMRPAARNQKEQAERIADPANRMRRRILSMFREMGGDWHGPNGYNWPRINSWMLKYGYLHKEMNAYKENELPALVTQVEKMLTAPYAKK